MSAAKGIGSTLSKPILSPLENAADAVKIKVCECLNKNETVGLALVSKTLKTISDKDQVWKNLFMRTFKGTIDPASPAKQQYFHESVVRSNIVKGRVVTKSFQAHPKDSGIANIVFHHGRIFTLSNLPNDLKIWENKGKGFQECWKFKDVYEFAVHDANLFILKNSKIEVWTESGKRYKRDRILSNISSVRNFKFANGRLFIASNRVVEIWEKHGQDFKKIPDNDTRSYSYKMDLHAGHLFVLNSSYSPLKIFEEREGFKTPKTLKTNAISSTFHAMFHDNKLFIKAPRGYYVYEKKGEEYEKVPDLTSDRFNMKNGLRYSATNNELEISDESSSVNKKISFSGFPTFLDVQDGKVLVGTLEGKVKIWDFSASKKEIFNALAEKFENPRLTSLEVRELKHLLLKMGKKDIDRIFGKLFKVLAPKNHYPKYAQDAFLGKNGKSCKPAQIAKAIRLFLDSEKKQPHPKPSNATSSSPSLAHKTQVKPKIKED